MFLGFFSSPFNVTEKLQKIFDKLFILQGLQIDHLGLTLWLVVINDCSHAPFLGCRVERVVYKGSIFNIK
jgi:hypothetical protein